MRTIIVRLLGKTVWAFITRNVDGFPESAGKSEKSIWEHYNEMAAVEDNIREVELRDLADTILVFVRLNPLYDALLLIFLQDGLFAAFLSAFLVFTIPQLQPNSTDIAMDVLIHISQQLSNSTTAAYSPAEFTVSPGIAVVNALFFLSLALILIDAFLAMLVKSWLQEFDRGWRKYTVAKLRAQERERRLQGFQRWKLDELVALLPILIQTSLLLFCVGLLVLLFPIHLISAILCSLAVVAGLIFYWFTTCVSIFDHYAPFSSPVSRGLMVLTNTLQMTWMSFVHQVQDIISSGLFQISHPISPPESEESSKYSTRALPGNRSPALSALLQSKKGTKNQNVITHSQSQEIDHQTYVNILERLVTMTAQVVDNIPVFLELLDQPVKDPTLRPSNVEDWRYILHITSELLKDSPTLSDSAARTIARTMLFCDDDGKAADEQLFRRLKYHFGPLLPGQTDKRKPLNFLFASYLDYYCSTWPLEQTVNSIIASLEPSSAADAELLWMVNTFHKTLQCKVVFYWANDMALEFFAAVLTYVSSTEQCRRSQVPLTAAVIYAMHAVMSAPTNNGIHSIDGHYIIPRTVQNTFKSMSVTFDQVDELDLWSDECIGLASALLNDWLEPDILFPQSSVHDVLNFQFALITALYIDSTKQADHASTTLTSFFRPANIMNITKETLQWTDVYDQAKLASYWYMALFQQPLEYEYGVQDIRFVILEAIVCCSEIRLPALHLLDFSMKDLCAMACPPSTLFTMHRYGDHLTWTAPGSQVTDKHWLFNDWVLLHLDTLFSPSHIIHPNELAQLEWADTPEQVHIAKARLALYDALQEQGKELMQTQQFKPEPDLFKLFLWSKDYEVCTGAFKWCLNLAALNQASSNGDVDIAGMLFPGAMGYQWIEHFIQVLCGCLEHETVQSWKFLISKN